MTYTRNTISRTISRLGLAMNAIQVQGDAACVMQGVIPSCTSLEVGVKYDVYKGITDFVKDIVRKNGVRIYIADDVMRVNHIGGIPVISLLDIQRKYMEDACYGSSHGAKMLDKVTSYMEAHNLTSACESTEVVRKVDGAKILGAAYVLGAVIGNITQYAWLKKHTDYTPEKLRRTTISRAVVSGIAAVVSCIELSRQKMDIEVPTNTRHVSISPKEESVSEESVVIRVTPTAEEGIVKVQLGSKSGKVFEAIIADDVKRGDILNTTTRGKILLRYFKYTAFTWDAQADEFPENVRELMQ